MTRDEYDIALKLSEAASNGYREGHGDGRVEGYNQAIDDVIDLLNGKLDEYSIQRIKETKV